MKAKYNRMIDEYVKKKYGDLDRGVLFKIYRKKYRKEKMKVKTLTADTGEKESQDSYLDKNSCYGCEHYVPMHPDEGLTIIPASCKLGKSMTACCPFYSVKVDGKKAQSSYLDWLHDDITWCCRECDDMDCERNLMNRKMTTGLILMADMFDPFKCPVDAEIPIDKKDKKC